MIPQRGSLLLVLLASHKLLNVDTSGLEHALDILFGVGRADLKHDRKRSAHHQAHECPRGHPSRGRPAYPHIPIKKPIATSE